MVEPKGYKAVKRALIGALLSGDYQHEARDGVDVKNLLSTGVLSAAQLIEIVKRSDGTEYGCSPLHKHIAIDCHVIKTADCYVKFYFVAPTTIFISVHQRERL